MPHQANVFTDIQRKRSVDRRCERAAGLARVAERQYGVVALSQLRELGFRPGWVQWAVETQRLHRLYRGVFAVGHRRISARGRWLAAVLACGDGALLSHCFAAVLLGMLKRAKGPIQVTVARRVRRRPGIRTFTAADLTAADRSTVDAIPCTSVARTLLGIAAVEPSSLEGAIAAAEKRELLDLTEIDSLIARSRRRPGVQALRQALAEHRVEYEWARSRLERRLFALCHNAGLPRPSVNAYVAVPGWAGEVDFSWSELGLIVETDGWDSHRDRAAFEADRRRDQHLVAAGWRVVRLTWRQVVYEPERVVETLRALAARGGALGRGAA